jgi:hypothetical protein
VVEPFIHVSPNVRIISPRFSIGIDSAPPHSFAFFATTSSKKTGLQNDAPAGKTPSFSHKKQ